MNAPSLAALCALVAACGPSTTKPPPAPPTVPADDGHEERERAEIIAKHRELESAQQDALGARCTDGAKWASQHCTPTCYPAEPASPRGGAKLAGPVEIEHRACQRGETGEWALVDDEVAADKLAMHAYRKRPPKPHKAHSWQADIEAVLGSEFVITGTAMTTTKHPLTHEALRCVKVAQYTHVKGDTVGACGLPGKVTCEVAGSAAARGLNLIRYRLAEAQSAHASGDDAHCQAAALDAIATARGMPRWRQYAKLNVGEWKEGLAYKTRFDGVLDEDALFLLATALGSEAEQLHATCGGPGKVSTTPSQEHAFHSCP